jgi:hypothetical protein
VSALGAGSVLVGRLSIGHVRGRVLGLRGPRAAGFHQDFLALMQHLDRATLHLDARLVTAAVHGEHRAHHLDAHVAGLHPERGPLRARGHGAVHAASLQDHEHAAAAVAIHDHGRLRRDRQLGVAEVELGARRLGDHAGMSIREPGERGIGWVAIRPQEGQREHGRGRDRGPPQRHRPPPGLEIGDRLGGEAGWSVRGLARGSFVQAGEDRAANALATGRGQGFDVEAIA